MKLVAHLISHRKRSLLALVLALALLGLPGLVPLCLGANAAAFAKHDCCQGRQTCHTQFQRSSCCEYQPGPSGSQPFTAGAHPADVAAAAPALTATLPAEVFIPKLFRASEDLSRRSQAPPLYLQKQSFLC